MNQLKKVYVEMVIQAVYGYCYRDIYRKAHFCAFCVIIIIVNDI